MAIYNIFYVSYMTLKHLSEVTTFIRPILKYYTVTKTKKTKRNNKTKHRTKTKHKTKRRLNVPR